MSLFDDLWQLLRAHGSSAKRETECAALARPPRQQTLSYADYYARYHTTEPRDGWQMANPTGQKVIYVRNG